MPTSYTELPIETLIQHQLAYEIINTTGKRLYANWDIIEFEKSVLGVEGKHYISTPDEETKLKADTKTLDYEMPFLQFGEPGIHRGYELFISPPPHWSSRGAPFFWAYASRECTEYEIQKESSLILEKYMETVRLFHIPFGKDEYVHFDRFSAGGMSSGQVGGLFVKEGFDIIKKRILLYR